jgi:hypothetical protein
MEKKERKGREGGKDGEREIEIQTLTNGLVSDHKGKARTNKHLFPSCFFVLGANTALLNSA